MSASSRRRVLLVGWDGADWNLAGPLLDAGLLPSLASLIERGVIADLSTPEPLVCSMLWTSLVTGRRAYDHGILGDLEPDEGGRVHLARSTSRRTKALWNLFSHSGLRSLVVGWPASHPAEPIEGVYVSDRFHRNLGSPTPAGTVHPRDFEGPLSDVRLRPDEITEAHIAPFVPGLRDLAAGPAGNDERLLSIAKTLAEAATVHAAVTWLIANEPWDFCAVRYEAIAALSRGFLRFTTPDGNNREDERLAYKDVVDGAYRFHDMMLGRLLELAGADTVVVMVSDHGMGLTPMPAVAHRARGLLIAAGPGIREDERIYGSSLLDVAPTILALEGIPLGEDLDGRPLLEILSDPPPVTDSPSWKEKPGAFGLPSERLESFDDLRLDETDQDVGAALVLRYNLARALLGAERARDADTVLDGLRKDLPDDEHLAILHAHALYATGELDRCRDVLSGFEQSTEPPPMADVLLGFLAFLEGRTEETLERLARAEESGVRLPRLHHEIGSAYLQMQQWEKAVRAYRRALEIDGGEARTRDGLASALLELDRPEEAAKEALHAIWLAHDLAPAHFHLGAALARIGERARAIEAFETCLSLDEKAAGAHLWLARLYESGAMDLEKALAHRAKAREILEP